MTALAIKRHSNKRTISLGGIRAGQTNKEFYEAVASEVRDFASDSIVDAAKEQYRAAKALPNRIAYDRNKTVIDLLPAQARRIVTMDTKSQTLTGFNSNIRFFYTDMTLLFRAVSVAWVRMMALTRVLRGNAAATYYFWCNDSLIPARSKKVSNLGQVRSWLAETTDPLATVSILGPTVEYRRPVIYNPKGRRQQRQWVNSTRAVNEGPATDRYRHTTGATRSRIGGKKAKDRAMTNSIKVSGLRRRKGKTYFSVQVAKAIGFMVRQEIRRQFRDIYSSYRFTRSREPLPIIDKKWKPDGANIHIPVLSLGLKNSKQFKNVGSIKG